MTRISNGRRLRQCLIGALAAGGLLSLLLLIALVLWLMLGLLGDPAGAVVSRVLALLFSICWFIDGAFLVVVLALAQLQPLEDVDEHDEIGSQLPIRGPSRQK